MNDDDFDGRNDPNPADPNTLDLLHDLRGKSVAELLVEGQQALLVELLAKLKTGVATHQELAILRNLLRDNGMVVGVAGGGERAREGALPPDLPEYGNPEYDE